MSNYILAFILFALPAFTLAQSAPSKSQQEPSGSSVKSRTERPSLAALYQREFAFLDTQKRELEKLLARFDRDTAAKERRLTRQIDGLQQQILALSLEAKRLEEQIIEAQRQQEKREEEAALLKNTLAQAKATLGDYGFPGALLEEADPSEQLARAFELGLQALRQSSSIHTEEGVFFLADGRQVSGKLIFLGNIAAYGVSPEGSGILLPAGENRLKLAPELGGEAMAQALAQGRPPRVLPAFLFENRAKAVELKPEKTFRQVLDDGGPIAWTIAALGAVGVIFAAIRLFVLARAGRKGDLVEQAVEAVHQDKPIPPAIESGKTVYARILQASLSHLHLPEEEWEIAIADALLKETVALERFSGVILVIAAVAPLLGLLGTVTGMIETFEIITRFGTGDPKLLATGISVALITTEVGLMVAIPLLLSGNLLNGWCQNLKNALELAALEVREAAQGARPVDRTEDSPSRRAVEA